MKLTFIFILLGLMSYASVTYSQSTKLTFESKNATIESVFKQIEALSEYKFAYNSTKLDVDKKISLKVENQTINNILDRILGSANFQYKIVDRYIIITDENLKADNLLEIGQTKKVTGTVTDASGNSLPGVSVALKGTTNGTITDVNGNYSLGNIPGNATLQYSFVGMKSQEIAVAGKTIINVTLGEEAIGIEEVVAVGYGTSKKSDISGSVVSVSREEMMKKAPTNILQGIKGQAAGVVVQAQDGSPDAASSIQIRGIATINGDTKPLYVIDGVVVGKDANFLAPSDIESIEILKDASATAIYGSAGANGVIMITTKHGAIGTTHVTFSADYGVQNLAAKLDVGNVDQYAKNIRQARANDGNGTSTGLNNQIFSAQYDGKRKSIDWQNEMTRPALRQQYTLSAQGGTEKTQQYFSLSYLNHDGIVINSNAKRLTGRASVVSKIADFLEVGGDINFIHSESKGNNAGLGNNGNLSSIRDMAFLCPTMDYVDPTTGTLVSPNVKNANGTYGTPVQGSVASYDGNLGNNIYAEQMEQTGVSKHNQTIISAYANIKLFKGLAFKTVGSYNFSADNWFNFWGNKKRYMPDGVTAVPLYNYVTDYHLGINNSNYNTTQLESYLTYNWKNDVHNVTLMAGNSVSREFGNWSNASGTDFPGDNIRDIGLTKLPTSRTGSGAYNLEVHNLSYFGRLQYSFKDRYILTSTIRRDGSSRFGVDNTWGTFPSVAAAWRVSEENFIKTIPAISNLKLRLGWGQTGNSGNMNSNLAVNALTSDKVQYNYYPQNGVLGAGSSSRIPVVGTVQTLSDTKLKWETNEQKNIGIDLGLFNNNLNVTVDFFDRASKDLLNYLNIRPSSGYDKVYTNLGGIDNKGYEFSINYKKQINQDWNISVTATGSHVKNEVTGMATDIYFQNTTGTEVGKIGTPAGTHWDNHSIMRNGYAIGSFYGYQVDHIYKDQAEVDAVNAAAKALGHKDGYNNGNATVAGDYKFKDLNGDGFLDAKDMTILGNGFPKLNYGLTINASYKNWDFTVSSYGVYGVQIYSYSAMTLTDMFPSDNGTTPNVLNDVAQNAWTPANNTNAKYARLSFLDKNYNMRGSDAWLKKGDYFKLSNIQVGYNFSKNLLKVVRLESARINASVQNVFTMSSYNKYGDPEIGQGVLFNGLDTGRYPMPRVYTLGLNIQF